MSDGTNSYSWDSRNQLSGISGVTTASFVYDPFGRRQAKTIGSASTSFLYDGVNPVQELSGGSVSANLLTGLGVDEYFNRTDALSSGYFLTDALGSTLALADPTGAVQTQYTYEPFGGTTTQGSSNANSYQYTGRENDGDGLYFYRARYYSPMFGRFVSEDLLRLRAGTINFYAYARNYAVGLTDSLGFCAYPDGSGTFPALGPHTPLPPAAGRKSMPVDPAGDRQRKCLNNCLFYQVGCETLCLGLNLTLPPPFGEMTSFACEVACERGYHTCLERCLVP